MSFKGDVENASLHSKVSASLHSAVTREQRKLEMSQKKTNERFGLGENVYALLVVAPLTTWPFFFALLVVAVKITILLILCSDVGNIQDLAESNWEVTLVKFFLIPVAIAMQEDMMDSFAFFANARYCPRCLEVSDAATKSKVYFSYFLRTCDGLLSLFVNYAVMLQTDDTLNVFLNFAALQFLYEIDDVFYVLATMGFFGDRMELFTDLCTKVTMVRRMGATNYHICGTKVRVSWLDTILFFVILVVCYIGYIVVTIANYSNLIDLKDLAS